MLEECQEFLTIDARINSEGRKFRTAVPEIGKIGPKVIRASETSYLPDEYRSDDIFSQVRT
jgi:hypothetical protein